MLCDPKSGLQPALRMAATYAVDYRPGTGVAGTTSSGPRSKPTKNYHQKMSVEQLKEVVSAKFATQSSSVRRAFRAVASPGQDRIGVEQVRRMLRNLNLGVGPKLARRLFEHIDSDGGGSISYEEFRAAFGESISGAAYEGRVFEPGANEHQARVEAKMKRMNRAARVPTVAVKECEKILKERMATQHTKVRNAFRVLDQDHSGFLDRDEFSRMLEVYNIKLSDDGLDELMRRIAGAEDSKRFVERISYAQFNTFFGASIAGGSYSNSTSMESNLIGSNSSAADQFLKSKLKTKPRIKEWTMPEFLATLEQVLTSRSKTVRRIFRMVDTDQSGTIDVKEFHAALSKLNIEMTFESAQKFFAAFDSDGSGCLSYEEVIGNFGPMIAGYKDTGVLTMNAMEGKDKESRQTFADMIGARADAQLKKMPPVPSYSVEQIKELIAKRLGNKYSSGRAAFREIDKDHTGSLGYDEFREFLARRNVEITDADFDAFVKHVDADADGEINYDEFLKSFGDAICGAPWESLKTGLETVPSPKKPTFIERPYLDAKKALDLLHSKLAETTSSVTRIFKRFNKGRIGYLTPAQFEFLFHNFNLHVDSKVVDQCLDLIFVRHGRTIPSTSSGSWPADDDDDATQHTQKNLDYQLFCAEFGPTISGHAFEGVVDPHAVECDRHVRDAKRARPTDPATALKLLRLKLGTHFKHNRTAFTRFNTVRDGKLDLDELRRALENYHIVMTDRDFETFSRDFDTNGTGEIDFQQFLAQVGQDVSGHCDTGLSIALQSSDDQAKEKRKLFEAQFMDLLEDDPDDDDKSQASETRRKSDDDITAAVVGELRAEEDTPSPACLEEEEQTPVPERPETQYELVLPPLKTDTNTTTKRRCATERPRLNATVPCDSDSDTDRSLARAVSLANLEARCNRVPSAAKRRALALERAKGLHWRLNDTLSPDDDLGKKPVKGRARTARPSLSQSQSAPRIVVHAPNARQST